MDNMVPKNILLRLSNDDEKAFEFIYWNTAVRRNFTTA